MTSPERILYVDDDAGLRRLVQRALQRRGFSVETAESADAGLALLKAGQFDLVAIDHQMPGKNGREMLAEIVALDDHPPVVFVTGNDDTQIAVEAMQAGASDFVVKTVGESFFDLLAGRFRQAFLRDGLERAKRQAEAELRDANARLEVLIREVHHRVANSLQLVSSFVSMQAAQTADPAARSALEDTQNRIQAVSKVHRRLYTRSDVAKIDLDEYLSMLVEELRASLPGDGSIALRLDADSVDVEPDQAVSVGVIVNELVGNAAKYAFGDGGKGEIAIALAASPDGRGYTVSVADDGAGISDTQPAGTGLGMRIVDAVARSLRSKVELAPGESGTAYRFFVPA